MPGRNCDRITIREPKSTQLTPKALQDDDTNTALLTCQMRGWVEPLHHALPSAQRTPDGALPPNVSFDKMQTLYRLTSAGSTASIAISLRESRGWRCLASTGSVRRSSQESRSSSGR
jgi:hypothetical protein